MLEKTSSSSLLNRETVASKIISLSSVLLSWGVTSSVGFRTLAAALDFLGKLPVDSLGQLWGDVLQDPDHLVVALVQGAAKSEWVSEESTGDCTSLTYFCTCLHRHFNTGASGESYYLIKQLDAWFINHVAQQFGAQATSSSPQPRRHAAQPGSASSAVAPS